MDNQRLNTILHHLAGGSAGGTLTDGQLLAHFVSRRDEAAFALLVRRHGPLVWGVCRRILGSPHDAEDAFQAVFLVLVRRAPALDRTGPLSAWLHGVACRVALRARETAARRRQHERAAGRAEAWADSEAEARDLRRVLDEELALLPDKYRMPLVLCYLEGLTHQEAARKLGWPLGTLKCRVLRGREQLRDRLARRGLAPCGPLPTVPPPTVAPPTIVAVTLAAALHFAAGSVSAGPASSQAVALTQGVLKTMTLSKLKIAAALLLAATFLSASAGGLALYARTAEPNRVALPTPAAEAGDQNAKTPEKAPKLSEPAPIGAKLEALWADLASDDEARAWRAAFTLATTPKDATTLFKSKLQPVTNDTDRLTKAIRELDSEDFDVREHASAELREAGDRAVPLIRKTLDGTPSIEARRRLEELVPRTTPRSTDGVRASRAVIVLEAIRGDEARKLLEALAKGQANAPPTRAAKAALDRLNGKPAAWQAHWDALGGKDASAALRAALAVLVNPKESLPDLKARLQKELHGEAAALDEKRIAKLLENLDADEYAVRENATADLIALGRPVVPLLRKARVGQPSAEVCRRLGLIMVKIQTASMPAGYRLIRVLARLDTPEARELLELVHKVQALNPELAFSSDGRRYVLTDRGGVQMSDGDNDTLLWATRLGRGAALCVAFSPDGKVVAAGTAGKTIYLIDATTGKLLRILEGHQAGVVGVSFSADGKTLESVDSGKTNCIWDIVTGQKLP